MKSGVLVLIFASLAYLLFQFSADPVRVFQTSVKDGFQISDEDLGLLFGVGYVPGLFSIIYGLVIDRIGRRVSLFMFFSFVLAGSALQAAAVAALDSERLFWLLALGRFVQGCGAEGSCLSWDAAITVHWRARLSFAISCWISASLIGDVLTFLVLPNIAEIVGDWRQVFYVCFSSMTVGFICCLVVIFADRIDGDVSLHKAEEETGGNEISCRSLLRSIRSMRKSYWVAVALNFFLYGTIYTMMSFAAELVAERYDESVIVSPMLIAEVPGVALVSTLCFGFLLTRYQRIFRLKFVLVAVASLLLALANLLWLMSSARWTLQLSLFLLGLAYGIVSSALWGSMGQYATDQNAGIVYAIPYSAFELASFANSYLSGYLIEKTGSSAAIALWIACAAISVLLSGLWLRLESQHRHEMTRVSSNLSNIDLVSVNVNNSDVSN